MDDLDLQSLLTSQGELVGSLAHDLKGLISGIDGGFYLMESGLKKRKQDRIDQGAEMVKRNVDRIRRVVSSVLYFVKDRDIDWHPVEIEDVLQSVNKQLNEYAAHLKVTLELKTDVESFEGNTLVVNSVLIDIIEFMLEACRLNKAKSSATVRLSTSEEKEQVRFDIFTDGFSIDPETREYALKPFYAPKGVDRSHLGLFIVHKLVKGYYGSLDISSSEPEGSTLMVVRLPKKNPNDS